MSVVLAAASIRSPSFGTSHRLLGVALLATLLGTLLATPTAADQRLLTVGEMRLALPADPGALLIEYDRIDGLAGKVGTRPRLRVYADGRVLIHQPEYRTDAGDWELRLSPQELDELLRQLVAAGVAQFDAAAVQAEKHRQIVARSQQGPRRVFVVADGPVIRLAVDLGGMQDARGRSLGAAQRSLRWANVQHEAKWYPEVAALRGLAHADRLLAELSERADKRRIELPPETAPPPTTTQDGDAEGVGHAH
jgi:hypothetical protein